MDVIVFGAGLYGRHYWNEIYSGKQDRRIIAFADNKVDKRPSMFGLPVILPEKISDFNFAKVVVANKDENARAEMLQQLIELGIPESQIEVFEKPSLDGRVTWLWNFARYVCEEGIKGNVAECGVAKGDFSQYINECFYDRMLYLFDTFEGFVHEDLEVERSLGNKMFLDSCYNKENPFGNTSIEVVTKKMVYPENCVFRVGRFPETAKDVKDTFCFVSLDMDIYKPMLSACKYFWNRMEAGGVILLHDYFHPELPGVKLAVEEFENSLGEKVPKIPIGDGFSIALVKR